MSSGDGKVDCPTHGATNAAFVCRHLAAGQGLGFVWGHDPEDPLNPCPDAWCSACDALLEAQGDWTDEAMAEADITLVCSGCYAEIRERNWVQDEAAYEAAVAAWFARLESAQAATVEAFQLNELERWDWDMETSQLVFSHDGAPRVIADVAFVGSLATTAGTWMWAWANASLPDNVRAALREVREQGEQSGFMKLAAAQWPADEHDGWSMAAFAMDVLGGVGVYRAPTGHGFLYMVILDAHRVQ